MLSFKKILTRVREFYENNKEDIKNQNLNVLEVFKRLNLRETEAVKINHDIVDKLKLQLDSITDTINGVSALLLSFLNSLRYLSALITLQQN